MLTGPAHTVALLLHLLPQVPPPQRPPVAPPLLHPSLPGKTLGLMSHNLSRLRQNLSQFCAIILKTKIFFFLPSKVPWGAYHIYRNFPFHKWFFKVEQFFICFLVLLRMFQRKVFREPKNDSSKISRSVEYNLDISTVMCHVAVMASLDSNVPIGCVLENLSWSSTSWLFLAYCFIHTAYLAT